MNNIIHALDKFWEVENRPKTDLSRYNNEELLTPKTANWLYIFITIFMLTVSVMFVCAGALS